MKKYIVIGSGILGASTAYQLAKLGAEVTVVDRGVPGQATDAAAGIICPWISQRRNQDWYALARAGARYYGPLIKELEIEGERDTGYARVGALRLHREREKLAALEKLAVERKKEAPEMGEIQLLEPGEVKRRFPPLDEGFYALYVGGAARVDGHALRESLLRAAVRHGAVLVRGEASLLHDGSAVTGVRVGAEEIGADAVAVCAGAWARQVLAPLGAEFQVSYQKAQIVHLALPGISTERWPVVMPPGDQYILAFDDGRIVIGATHENDPPGYDTRVTAGGLHEVINKALVVAPGLADGSFLEVRVGFRPFTPDFLPVFGALPGWEGIFAANGLGASGLTMGPYIGAQLAQMMLGRETEIRLENYRLEKALAPDSADICEQ
ncbi:FAD-binding oxidoreductase [Paenibacillus timonensis]|uniref:NAD(P)/FAD-dependent oxidoreductase n=1 Tax=Paenibacillus timonensis TaxID=225915 RepID=A0ABW3S6W2_9BACL|nr:FAD-binding oxidoreductase [Paenibacillus timonensis]MCH1638528.1 FAD-binding oxidoreductase [Paenibacillus timonensis]